MLELLTDSPYVAYLYSYPHKTSYRRLDPEVALDELWAAERRDALFLYLHVPFCEMRCGFCNLFTAARPADDFVDAYLDAMTRQALRTRTALGPDARFARMAIGGGTPTILPAAKLERLFDIAERTMGASLRTIPISVETSPETALPERLRILGRRGVDRVSIGVQSFFDAECAAVNRPQKTAQVEAALDAIRSTGFPTLNIDLMYGLPGQTRATWLASLERAVRFRPEELYLYPLYVRPVTVLSRREAWDDERLAMYRAGRDLLLASGYRQISMRMFRAVDAPGDLDAPVYCCQSDGMVGIGCGARSYTESLHYATEYAVGARGVERILEAYVAQADFGAVVHGIRLDGGEQRRRHVILSLLADGVDLAAYRARFGTEALDDLPQLAELAPRGLATLSHEALRLTPAGVERSDLIGPWLCSARVHDLMTGHELR
jgi:oxygen-independent coproporphyrinogen-3 oxidase